MRLQKILDIHMGMDLLYSHVITEALEYESFNTVMGSLMYLQYPLAINNLSEFLGLEISDIRMALDGCHSILTIPEEDTEEIRPYHASLQDFLTNQKRSENL